MKFLKLLIPFLGIFLFSKAFGLDSFDKVIVGDFEPNWLGIESVEDGQILEQSKAVGRLILPAKKNSACTAFLISDEMVMTNAHCVRGPEDAVGAKIYLNYINEGERQTFICDQFITNNKKLDYAILKCEGSPGSIFGKVKLSQVKLETGMHIYIIHQNCDYYQNGRCKRTKKVSFGMLTGQNSIRITYNADTLPGSSGSPVFSQDSHEVIGLHNNGSGHEEINGRRNGRGKMNLGIKMSEIVREIQTIFPDLP
jgi:V8-like Glu-specific endopeptidase